MCRDEVSKLAYIECPVDWVSLQRFPCPARCPQRMTTEEMEYGAIQSYNTREVPAATEISPSFLAAGANLFCGARNEDGRETGRERVVVAAAARWRSEPRLRFFDCRRGRGTLTQTHTAQPAGQLSEAGAKSGR
jgi:hypothetical protein